MDQTIESIRKVRKALEKVNHVLSYLVVAGWLLVLVVWVVKMVSRLWN